MIITICRHYERIKEKFKFAKKLESFGWEAYECDGHDIDAIYNICDLIKQSKLDRPKAIIFHTTKGKGISFIEGDTTWHYGILDEESYKKALSE